MKDIVPKAYRDRVEEYNSKKPRYKMGFFRRIYLQLKGVKVVKLKMGEMNPSDFRGLAEFKKKSNDQR